LHVRQGVRRRVVCVRLAVLDEFAPATCEASGV